MKCHQLFKCDFSPDPNGMCFSKACIHLFSYFRYLLVSVTISSNKIAQENSIKDLCRETGIGPF
jgi:hypothetical protein